MTAPADLSYGQPTIAAADGPVVVAGYETKRFWDDNMGIQPDGTIPVAPAGSSPRRQRAMPLDRDVIVFSSTE